MTADRLARVRDALLDSRGWHVNNPTRAQLAACERDAHSVLAALNKHDAGLGVGHIWTAVRCPAYRTLDGADCTCDGGGK